VCRSKHVEQLRNIGIINSTTRSHLVGYFYTICIMMHGSMNIKFKISVCKCDWHYTNYHWNNVLSHLLVIVHSQARKRFCSFCFKRFMFLLCVACHFFS